MGGIEHRKGDVGIYDKKSTFFFGENLGTGPHVVKDGHFTCAMPRQNEIRKRSALRA